MSDSNIGNVRPYGPPIFDAIASGDATRMRQIRESAHQWLKANPGDAGQGEVHAALRKLDEALGSNS